MFVAPAMPEPRREAIRERIDDVRVRIAAAARAAGRDPAGIALLAVTKRFPREAVVAAFAAGVRDVGENYVQEARPKYAGLDPALRKHFIGRVQTNKARAIVETFDVVQGIDRLDAGTAIAKAGAALGRTPRVLIQVNISPAERNGVAPADAGTLAEALRAHGLAVDGVMAIGPITTDAATLDAAFATAARAWRDVGGETLSLGMSGDFERAIAHGSTMVRVGTAIFGERRKEGDQ